MKGKGKWIPSTLLRMVYYVDHLDDENMVNDMEPYVRNIGAIIRGIAVLFETERDVTKVNGLKVEIARPKKLLILRLVFEYVLFMSFMILPSAIFGISMLWLALMGSISLTALMALGISKFRNFPILLQEYFDLSKTPVDVTFRAKATDT